MTPWSIAAAEKLAGACPRLTGLPALEAVLPRQTLVMWERFCAPGSKPRVTGLGKALEPAPRCHGSNTERRVPLAVYEPSAAKRLRALSNIGKPKFPPDARGLRQVLPAASARSSRTGLDVVPAGAGPHVAACAAALRDELVGSALAIVPEVLSVDHAGRTPCQCVESFARPQRRVGPDGGVRTSPRSADRTNPRWSRPRMSPDRPAPFFPAPSFPRPSLSRRNLQ